MATPKKQQKHAQRAKTKAKQNRAQRTAPSTDNLDPNDSRIDFESVDLSELFDLMRAAQSVSQQAMCTVFLAHPLLALVVEQEGEETATDFIIGALLEYRQWTTGEDEESALAWIESAQFQTDYVAASQELAAANLQQAD